MQINQKGVAPVAMVLGAVILVAAVFLIPLPYYLNTVLCSPGFTCPREGWNLGKPLLTQILTRLNTPSSEGKTVYVSPLPVSSSPANEIANWKRFESPIPVPIGSALMPLKNTISILYPPFLRPEYVQSFNDRILVFKPSNPEKAINSYTEGEFMVSIATLESGPTPLWERVNSMSEPGPLHGIETRKSFTPITVGGLSGFRVETVGRTGHDLGVYLPYRDRIIAITASYASEAHSEEHIRIFDMMVNSIAIN